MSTFFLALLAISPLMLTQHWIGGQWVDAQNSETLEVINPRHGRSMGRAVMSGSKDVEAAVETAKKALPEWRERPIRERGEVMYNLAI